MTGAWICRAPRGRLERPRAAGLTVGGATVAQRPQFRLPERSNGHPFRLGVLLDSNVQERWVLETLREALAVPGVKLACFVFSGMNARKSIAARLHRVLDRVDKRLRCPSEMLFAPVDVVAEFPGTWRLNIAPVRRGARWSFDEAGIADLRRCFVDLWLCFAATEPQRPLPQVSRCGVWGLEIGLCTPATSAWAGAVEVTAGSPVTLARVVDYTEQEGAPVCQVIGATVNNSARRNRLIALRRALSFFGRSLLGVTGADRRAIRGGAPESLPNYPVSRGPTVPKVLQLGLRLLATVAMNRWHALCSKEQWQIAYQFGRGEHIDLARLRYLVPPKDRFWADPFAFEHQGRYFILFEELFYRTQRGRILAVEVHENAEPGGVTVVLERPYHISYPFVFRWEGVLYMLPETAQNGTLELYRCEGVAPFRWRLHRVLLENIRAFDATLWQGAERWWMFVSVAPPGTDGNDELHLYSSATPLGPWIAHRRNPVLADTRRARSAGPLFQRGGLLYRPSQDCSIAYGHSVSINRVDVLTDDDYRETPVDRIEPGWRKDIIRVHTLGRCGPLRVVDLLVRRTR